MLILSRDDMRRALDAAELFEAMTDGFRRLAQGEWKIPLRVTIEMPAHDGVSLFMPAYCVGLSAAGMKLVTVMNANPAKNLPLIHSKYLYVSAETGEILSLMDAEILTGLRTAVVSALVTDLLGKRIDFMIDPPTLLIEFARAGKLRPLAVTGATRFFSLPDVPTISEAAVPGYVVTSWQGLAGPAGIPTSIVDRLNIEVADILTETATIERFRALGNDPRPSSSDEFKARIIADINKWTGVVAGAHIERI